MKWIKPILVFLLGLIVLLCLFCGCAPHRAVISPYGKVIERDGDSYLILWRDLADKPFSYAYNWVYLPGIDHLSIDDMQVIIKITGKESNHE